jgi:Ca2+-binding EF-hand superfamily protein
MSSVSAAGGLNPFAYLQQSLFNQISNGTGSITQSELEQAVTSAGGTTQAADALYAELDPNNTGSVSEQQFAQNLPLPQLSVANGAQLIGFQASGWPGSSGGAAGSQVAQSLFNQISNGSGSITQSELEQAVTSAGGTTQAADALYAKLDPNNTGSVSEQQFAQTLSQMAPHHHHGGHGGHGAHGADSAQGALSSLIDGTSDSSDDTSSSDLAQTLFSQIAPSGSSSFTQSELEQAVTSAGGTTQGADALYAQLDPNNTGSVTEAQLAQYLAPPSPTGNTAQDALLALMDPESSTSSATSSTSATTSSSTTTETNNNLAQSALQDLMQSFAASQSSGTTGASANTAQDALLALLDGSQSSMFGGSSQDPLLSMLDGSSGSNSFGLSTSGNTAEDALFALLQNSGATSASASNTSSTTNGTSNANSTNNNVNSSDLAMALAMYQNQMNQQLFGNVFGSSMGI